MDVGLMMSFANPSHWRRPFADLYREQLDEIVLAEELGFDTIWLTEHHFDVDGWSPSVLPIAAAIAARTDRVRIGSFILVLPFNNALRVAEDAATVDIISNGRFDLGVGQGYRVKEFNGFGVPRAERSERLQEGLEVIRRAWTEDNFSFEGKYYQLSDVTLAPKPVQQPHPPLWIGARGPKALDRAARLGCHFMGTGSVEAQQQYDEALRRHGRYPGDYSVAQVLVGVHVAATREQAWEQVGNQLHHMLSSVLPFFKEAKDLPGDELTPDPPSVETLSQLDPAQLPFGSPIVGSPDDCIRAIERYRESGRVTHIAFDMHIPGLAPEVTRESMTRFAHEVMPHFK